MESLTVLANNIANDASPGFKADRESYGLYAAPEASASGAGHVSYAPVIERNWTDFSPGTLVETANAADLAIRGDGFFAVRAPEGVLLTRSGAFRVSGQGRLETQHGHAVLDAAGAPIALQPNQAFEVTPAGDIRQNGQTVARLALFDVDDRGTLAKKEGVYFQLASDGGPASPGGATALPAALRAATGAELLQGRLERSNHSAPDSAVRLIGVLRQFEMLQKAVQIGSEMGRRADEVARVG
jgi:flagellar basal body rod protein FlgG